MTTYESFVRIPEFPNYMISSFGRVFNLHRNLFMSLSPIESGELTVGLHRDGVQYRRSVKVLVAQAFVPGGDELFDTPILLDMDRENLHADNIVWRPRWFAWRYARQFENLPDWVYSGPIIETESGVIFDNILEAAMGLGALILDIKWCLLNKKPVFPFNYIFAYKH